MGPVGPHEQVARLLPAAVEAGDHVFALLLEACELHPLVVALLGEERPELPVSGAPGRHDLAAAFHAHDFAPTTDVLPGLGGHAGLAPRDPAFLQETQELRLDHDPRAPAPQLPPRPLEDPYLPPGLAQRDPGRETAQGAPDHHRAAPAAAPDAYRHGPSRRTPEASSPRPGGQ
ncbi:MAG: hypothetical protein AVDCRST_MAG25-2716 [uncultured Rubrobacteraceae bacterium]|uniref:Uncharacterized protein n=1 Tax=uncultured Rubrobacteraceae bacterium TaxID=349277 RepID=A0A6J4S0Y0_9ACTN|nr:MAG: hypothetical protein AVDCRST_MAG25-2716 [uncultured Rubrobacteraceae bacterium]